MKEKLFKAAAAAVLAVMIISGGTPIKPIAYFFERTGITVNAQAGDFVNLNELTGDYVAQDEDVLMGTSGNYKISIADGANVVLNGADINFSGITCLGDAVISLEGNNSINSVNYSGIFVPDGKTLTIDGSGSLNISGGAMCAGIGADYSLRCGNITINGGTVTAKGGVDAAGIGCGNFGDCGNITINGGTVTATGGDKAAGIGGGCYGDCGNITINGGTVTATGGDKAAGIGGGCYGNCGNITINGGTVTATGGGDAAGIGCGVDSYCGDITITYKITLTGGANAVKTGDDIYKENIIYTANEGYHFGEFEDIVLNGVTVHRESDYKVTVSGRPTCDTKITIPDAVKNSSNISEFSFENGSPDGWTTEQTDNDYCWEWGKGDSAEDTGAYRGQYNMKLSHSDTSRDKTAYLITPKLDFSGLDAASLEFWYINRPSAGMSTYADRFGVYYRIGTSGEWNELFYTKANHNTWTYEKIYLPADAMQENVYIRFMAKTHFGCGVGLDNIVFTKTPPLSGDADLDGKVTDKDAALVLKYTGTNTPFFADDEDKNEMAILAANADCKGEVDILDVIKILQIAEENNN
ncbi:MAG: hypothetical protein IKS17_02050 [Firmicutes bacterium]|nr:hypothetical protein [Bacillota bacterium]